ncbi:ROK family protein [Curtobacterium sp. RRHDQ10]|uniref:ROK family protein n=1 Tax=Curtobacterium phyllosphaerae TaxID=3413379 RepID=UPI003BF1C3CD
MADGTAASVVGVMDIGGGHVTAALVDAEDPGHVLVEAESPLDPHASRDVLLDTIAATGRRLLVPAGPAPVRWAIAIPGPFDYAAGSGTFEGVEKFRALAGVDLRAGLASRLGVAPGAVGFLNDATAYGLGEWAAGAGARVDRLVCVTLGTGVGSAFLDGGHEVDSGPDVPPGGEAHLIRIEGEPLETVISTRALTAAYTRLTGRGATVAEICAAARAGEADAALVMRTGMLALGRALSPWIERFGATRVVVGGSIARSWDVIGAPLRDGLGMPDVEVVPAELGAVAPVVGAAAWALG